jgi:hypothetical protein
MPDSRRGGETTRFQFRHPSDESGIALSPIEASSCAMTGRFLPPVARAARGTALEALRASLFSLLPVGGFMSTRTGHTIGAAIGAVLFLLFSAAITIAR